MLNQDCLADNTAKIQRGRPFAKGASGNPHGRPKGSRNKTTLAMEALLEEESEDITRTLIKHAKKGDMLAMKLVMERLYPPRKDAHVEFELCNIESMSDLITAFNQVLKAVCAGELTPQEAQQVCNLIDHQKQTIVAAATHWPCADI
jgi:hypothetical protein